MTDTILLTIDQQPVDTPAPFQLMVNMPLNEFKTLINSTLSNIRFAFDKNFNTPIYSWLESMTDTNAVFWLNLPNGIKAGQQMTIYILFLPLSSEFDGVYAGCAPQLSATYGEYDNGALVFNFYDNFAGTALNTSKWNSAGTPSVDNGITLAYPSYIGSVTTYTAPSNVLDFYANITAINAGSVNADYGYIADTAQYTPSVVYAQNNGVPSSNNGSAFPWIVNSSQTFLPNGIVGQYIYSVYWSSSICKFWWDYTNEQFGTANIPTSALPIGFYNNQGAGTTFIMTWVRIRAYPPNGVMPTVKIGKYLPLPITISAPQPI